MLAAVDCFLSRVFLCGFTLNGKLDGSKALPIDGGKYLRSSKQERWELIERHAEEQFDFLGERYDLGANTRSMTVKTAEKLDFVWGLVTQRSYRVTHRQFFSLVGLLVYATGVLALPTGGYFNIFRKIRWLSSALHKDESLWDSELVVGLSIKEKEDLKGWVEVAARNEPVPTLSGKKDPPPFDRLDAMIIIVDASEWGRGALLYSRQRVLVTTSCGQWRAGEDYRSSVKAEPRGVREAVSAFMNQIGGVDVAILTDHEGLVWARRAMFTHSYWYNGCFLFLEDVERKLGGKFYFYFLEGKRNIADSLSRGKGVEETSFPEIAGTGMVCASLCPWQL